MINDKTDFEKYVTLEIYTKHIENLNAGKVLVKAV